MGYQTNVGHTIKNILQREACLVGEDALPRSLRDCQQDSLVKITQALTAMDTLLGKDPNQPKDITTALQQLKASIADTRKPISTDDINKLVPKIVTYYNERANNASERDYARIQLLSELLKIQGARADFLDTTLTRQESRGR